ncbi:MAG: hypothetical protein ABI867_15825 [Kofleriaceae bacterium]
MHRYTVGRWLDQIGHQLRRLGDDSVFREHIGAYDVFVGNDIRDVRHRFHHFDRSGFGRSPPTAALTSGHLGDGLDLGIHRNRNRFTDLRLDHDRGLSLDRFGGCFHDFGRRNGTAALGEDLVGGSGRCNGRL